MNIFIRPPRTGCFLASAGGSKLLRALNVIKSLFSAQLENNLDLFME